MIMGQNYHNDKSSQQNFNTKIMGNDLTGQSQSGKVITNLLSNIQNNPSVLPFAQDSSPLQQQPQPNNRPYSNMRNTRFVRGDEQLPTIYQTGAQNQQQPSYGNQSMSNRSVSPVKGLMQGSQVSPGLGSGSLSRPLNGANASAWRIVADPRGSQVAYTPTSIQQRRPQRFEQPKPFNFFQTFFGNEKSETQNRLRSSSASHASNDGRKTALLQSSLQVAQRNFQQSQKKIQDLSKTLQSLQSTLRTSQQSRFQAQQTKSQTEKAKLQLQSSLKSCQTRIQYLQSQLSILSQQLQKHRQQISQKQKSISSLQSQTFSQRNQIHLQQNRLNQYALRQQRKDKQIRELSLSKFQLNSVKIRLENNIKILQDQVQDRDRKIQQLEKELLRKNKQIELSKNQREQLEKNVMDLRNDIQHNFNKHMQQKNNLNQAIRENLVLIDQKQQKILDLTSKIDKYYQTHLQTQSAISNLQSQLTQHKTQIQNLNHEKDNKHKQINSINEQLQKIRQLCDQQKQQAIKHRDIGQKILADFNNARKVGQKQIQFLESKVQQLSKQKQRLLQQIEITKNIAIQRNKVFQRSVIYQLKQQNDKLWNKLIQKSNNQADLDGNGDQKYWKNKIQQHKSMKRSRIGHEINVNINNNDMNGEKNQLQARFDSFMRQLDANANNGNVSNGKVQSARNHQYSPEDIDFYRERCAQLQKMVESHIVMNKDLRDHLQKYTNYQSVLRNYDSQVQSLKNQKNQLLIQNKKLKQGKPDQQLTQKRSQTRVKQLQAQLKKYYQDVDKIRRQLDIARTQAKRHLDEVNRLNTQITVYKKWQALYDELKIKYDAIQASSKQDYKGMYQDVIKQQQRLKGLYQLKESDYQKLKKSTNQKIEHYQKQIKVLQQAADYLKRELQNRWKP